MKLREIIYHFNESAPIALQEDYDNSGLQTGNPDMEVNGALICLDVTEPVIEEAIASGFNLVVCHHPLIFSGIKRLSGSTETERVIIKAVKNDIAVFAVHTNLDSVREGVNERICDKLGLVNRKILRPLTGNLMKLAYFVPVKEAGKVRESVFRAGAGHIGNYDQCSFNVSGTGTFRASDAANPFVGKKGELHEEPELKTEVIFPDWKKDGIIAALIEAHPYEEVAYDIYPLANSNPLTGMGMLGEFEEEMEEYDFLNAIKTVFNAGCVRYSALAGQKIKRVAVCGGSGSGLLRDAIRSGAQAFITADVKYHQFFEPGGQILLADIGHYESEQFTKELLFESLNEKFPKFAVRLSEINTNPINYL